MGDTPWVIFRQELVHLDIYYGRLTIKEFHDYCFPDARKTCKGCGSPTRFIGWGTRSLYRPFCSRVCKALDPDIIKRTQEKKRERGNVSYLQTPEGRARYRRTCMKKFGAPYYSVSNDMFAKKPVRDKFGKTHKLQGYEPRAIKVLNQMNNVEEIVSGVRELPVIRYNAKDGKRRRYYPDLLVRTGKCEHLIEVKSLWTLKEESVIRKAKAATEYMRELGGHYWIFLFTKHGLTKLKDPTASDIRKLL